MSYSVNKEVLSEFEKSGADYRHVHKGELIFPQGTYPNQVGLVLSGRSWEYELSEKGEVAGLRCNYPGSIIGYLDTLPITMRKASIEALENGVVSMLPVEEFFWLLRERPPFRIALLSQFQEDWRFPQLRLGEKTERAYSNNSDHRLSCFILHLAEQDKAHYLVSAGGQADEYDPNKDSTINLLTRQKIASFIGVTEEEARRATARLKNLGVIKH